jgi:hypothetical protein
MTAYRLRAGVLVAIALSACGQPPRPAAPAASPTSSVSTPPPSRARKAGKLVVLPAESHAFPRAARATTQSLLQAQVAGVGAPQVSKVSLEVVQLSIECVDPSVECYEAVGRSLTANRLLFAQIAPVKRRQLKVTVTLFAVGARRPKTTVEKVFASEDAAADGIAALVAEATRP